MITIEKTIISEIDRESISETARRALAHHNRVARALDHAVLVVNRLALDRIARRDGYSFDW